MDEQLALSFNDKMLSQYLGHVPEKAGYIEFLQGTFLDSVVVHRIYNENVEILFHFLRKRGIPVVRMIFEGGKEVFVSGNQS